MTQEPGDQGSNACVTLENHFTCISIKMTDLAPMFSKVSFYSTILNLRF